VQPRLVEVAQRHQLDCLGSQHGRDMMLRAPAASNLQYAKFIAHLRNGSCY